MCCVNCSTGRQLLSSDLPEYQLCTAESRGGSIVEKQLYQWQAGVPVSFPAPLLPVRAVPCHPSLQHSLPLPLLFLHTANTISASSRTSHPRATAGTCQLDNLNVFFSCKIQHGSAQAGFQCLKFPLKLLRLFKKSR